MRKQYKTLQFHEVIALLKAKNIIVHRIKKNGNELGYFINNRYLPSNIFWVLRENKALIINKIAFENRSESWIVAKDTNLDLIENKPIMIKCANCENLFEKKGNQKTCCKKCGREYHNKFMRKKEKPAKLKKPKEIKKPKQKKVKNKKVRQSIISPTGCELVAFRGRNSLIMQNCRCDKYENCKHQVKCLYAIPEHWRGFKCINNHIGFEQNDNLKV